MALNREDSLTDTRCGRKDEFRAQGLETFQVDLVVRQISTPQRGRDFLAGNNIEKARYPQVMSYTFFKEGGRNGFGNDVSLPPGRQNGNVNLSDVWGINVQVNLCSSGGDPGETNSNYEQNESVKPATCPGETVVCFDFQTSCDICDSI